jgi:predicted bacteriocin transport accessory protein
VKKTSLLSLGLLLIPLASCKPALADHYSLVFKNYDITNSTELYKIPMSLEKYQFLIETKQDFIMLIGRKSCPSCQTFEPILELSLQEKQELVYFLDVESPAALQPFVDLYPTHFEDLMRPGNGTPFISFYQEGNYIRTPLREKYRNENAFKTVLHAFSSPKEAFYLETIDNFNTAIKDQDAFVFYHNISFTDQSSFNEYLLKTKNFPSLKSYYYQAITPLVIDGITFTRSAILKATSDNKIISYEGDDITTFLNNYYTT